MKKFIVFAITAVIAGLVYSADYTPATKESQTAQVDTNLTIVVTNFVPKFVGQVLVGTGSNTVYVAAGVTTGSWVKVSN